MIRGLLTIGIALLTACGSHRDDVIVVGAKNFTEQRILGELLAQTVESVGLKAERKFDLGGTFVCDAALRAGQIDMYVEYTGTALAAILKEDPTGRSAREVYDRVKEVYAKDGLVWMEPLGFDNTFALVIRGEDADRLGVRTISDIVPYAKDWRAGFGYEFKERADGYPALQRIYGLSFAEMRLMDLGLLYRALLTREISLAAGNATDGQIERLRLSVLADDRSAFPPYEGVPVVRRPVLDRFSTLAAGLRRLAGSLSPTTMRHLNAEVDGLHRSPRDVVTDILRESRATNP